MLDKLYICTGSEIYYKYLEDCFKNINFFGISFCSDIEFAKDKRFDIIHFYAIISEKIGGRPRFHESEIVETKGKYDFVPYVVLSPGFKTEDNLTEWECTRLQIEIPLTAVIKFSENIKKTLTYAVHTDIVLGKKNYNAGDFEKVKNIFCNVLVNRKLL